MSADTPPSETAEGATAEPARWVAIPNSVWFEVAPDLWMFQDEGRTIRVGLRGTGYCAPKGCTHGNPDHSNTWLVWRVDAWGDTTYWERDSEPEARRVVADSAAHATYIALTSGKELALVAGRVYIEQGRVPDLDWEPAEGGGWW